MRNILPGVASAILLLAMAGASAQNQNQNDHDTAPMFPAGTAPAYTPPASFTPGAPGPVPGAPPGGATSTSHEVTDFAPVTDAMLRNPDAADWLMLRGNY